MWWAKRVTNGQYQTLVQAPDEAKLWFDNWLKNYMRNNPPGVYMIFHDRDTWATKRQLRYSDIDELKSIESSYAEQERKVTGDSQV